MAFQLEFYLLKNYKSRAEIPTDYYESRIKLNKGQIEVIPVNLFNMKSKKLNMSSLCYQ